METTTPEEITVALASLKKQGYEVMESAQHIRTGYWVIDIYTEGKHFILLWQVNNCYGISQIKEEAIFASRGIMAGQEMTTKDIAKIVQFIQKRL